MPPRCAGPSLAVERLRSVDAFDDGRSYDDVEWVGNVQLGGRVAAYRDPRVIYVGGRGCMRYVAENETMLDELCGKHPR